MLTRRQEMFAQNTSCAHAQFKLPRACLKNTGSRVNAVSGRDPRLQLSQLLNELHVARDPPSVSILIGTCGQASAMTDVFRNRRSIAETVHFFSDQVERIQELMPWVI